MQFLKCFIVTSICMVALSGCKGTMRSASFVQSASLGLQTPITPSTPSPVVLDAQVYSGCAVPPMDANHVWYVDANRGSDSTGDGSQSAPWKTLQSVVSSVGGASPRLASIPYSHMDGGGNTVVTPNPSAPVKPGDEILLMSGNYGDIVIGATNATISNSQFVIIAAAPGETPVLSSLTVKSTDKWYFYGLKVQNLKTAGTPYLVSVSDQGTANPTSDIVFQKMLISSADDISSWTQAYWLANGQNGWSAGGPATTCISLTESHIENVSYGASIMANQSLISNNEIDHFGQDGLQYAASNLTFTKNYLHDSSALGDRKVTNDQNAMLGVVANFSGGVVVDHFHDLLFDGNKIIRQMASNLQFPAPLQGIVSSTGDWTRVTLTNNVVVTSGCLALGYTSLHDSTIAFNTAIEDWQVATLFNCGPQISILDKTPQGTSSSNSVIRDNLCSDIRIYNLDPGVEFDHNVGVSYFRGPGDPRASFIYYANGVLATPSAGGRTYPTNNYIDTEGTSSEFMSFDATKQNYDLRLKATAPAVGYGVEILGVPSAMVDFNGEPRVAPYSVGAFIPAH